jgi:hypothetical protein
MCNKTYVNQNSILLQTLQVWTTCRRPTTMAVIEALVAASTLRKLLLIAYGKVSWLNAVTIPAQLGEHSTA